MRATILSLTCGTLPIAACGCNMNGTPSDPPRAATLPSGHACKLSPEQLATRRQQLIPGLFQRAAAVSDIPNGLRFRFVNEPGLLSDLSRVVEQEQDCCSFLRFQLTTEPNAGPVTFDVTGPPGTGDMLRKL